MMTYREIIEEVKKQFHITIYHTCWIASVKRDYGLTKRYSWNYGSGNGAPPCPAHVYKGIERVLRKKGLI